MDEQLEMRKRYRVWARAINRGEDRPFPEGCQDLRCGAKTRVGTPCKRLDLGAGGRCRLHGGLSTGPKSGPRAKRPVPPKPEKPYDPEQNPEFMAMLRKQGLVF